MTSSAYQKCRRHIVNLIDQDEKKEEDFESG